MKVTTLTLLSCMLAWVAFGAKKERDWKLGSVLDSKMSTQAIVTGSTTHTSGSATASGSGTANTTGTATTLGNTTTIDSATAMNGTATARGQSSSWTAIQRIAVQSNELLIIADKYLYVIQDVRTHIPGAPLRNALANRKHGCRFYCGRRHPLFSGKRRSLGARPGRQGTQDPIVRQEAK